MSPASSRLHEKPVRSLLKAVTWRIFGSIDTFLLATLFTGGMVAAAAKIAVAEILTKTALYFFHERVWSLAGFGQEARISTRYRRHHPLHRKSADKFRRSAAKTITWRVLASLDTVLLSWFFTGSFKVAAAIGGFEVITKLVLYFFHERLWARLRVGLEKTPDVHAHLAPRRLT